MHTKEPWEINIGEYLGRRRLESKNEHGVVNDGWIIGEFEGPDAEDNVKRIKDCVNALAGVPDPADDSPGCRNSNKDKLCQVEQSPECGPGSTNSGNSPVKSR